VGRAAIDGGDALAVLASLAAVAALTAAVPRLGLLLRGG
jgi:hypothetical protein